jgi:FlgD Ig-like domain
MIGGINMLSRIIVLFLIAVFVHVPSSRAGEPVRLVLWAIWGVPGYTFWIAVDENYSGNWVYHSFPVSENDPAVVEIPVSKNCGPIRFKTRLEGDPNDAWYENPWSPALCPGYTYWAEWGPGVNLTPSFADPDPGFLCYLPDITVPTGAYPVVEETEVQYGEWDRYVKSYTIRKRYDNGLPEGTFIYMSFPNGCSDLGNTSEVYLAPVSGTGPVFPFVWSGGQYVAYFRIDNLMAPGTYSAYARYDDGSVLRLSDSFSSIQYEGASGYVPSGRLLNAVTGNTIRGAGVSIWQSTGSGFNLYAGTTAVDGTYYFDVPSGTYKILVQYELAGEHWTDEFGVNSPIPGGDIDLTPVSDDQIPPELQVTWVSDSTASVVCSDGGVGLAVVELLPETLENVLVALDLFEDGANEASAEVVVLNPALDGRVTIRGLDRLGNESTVVVSRNGAVPVDDPPGTDVFTNHLRVRAAPNPFNPSTTIFYRMPRDGEVSIEVYDLAGRRIKRLFGGFAEAGDHQLEWNGRDERGAGLATGVYLLRATAGGELVSTMLTIMK